jgi:hypothetical protein
MAVVRPAAEVSSSLLVRVWFLLSIQIEIVSFFSLNLLQTDLLARVGYLIPLLSLLDLPGVDRVGKDLNCDEIPC